MIEDIEKEQPDETSEETGEEAPVDASDEAAAEEEAEAADSAVEDSADKADDEVAAEDATEAPGEEVAERTPEEEATELKDRLLRALADVENTRRRADRDLDEMRRYGASNFAKDLLNVCDNLGRALASTPDDIETHDESFQTLVAGVEMVEKELLAAFEKHGIKKIDSVGEMFNHDFHQAMYEVEDTGRPAGTIVEVLDRKSVV